MRTQAQLHKWGWHIHYSFNVGTLALLDALPLVGTLVCKVAHFRFSQWVICHARVVWKVLQQVKVCFFNRLPYTSRSWSRFLKTQPRLTYFQKSLKPKDCVLKSSVWEIGSKQHVIKKCNPSSFGFGERATTFCIVDGLLCGGWNVPSSWICNLVFWC